VGGDIAAGVLLTGLEQDARNAVLLDLGTNSEIVISCRGELAASSCPAGPAFEGGRIKCGMPGLPGAVEAVRILPGSTIALKTIGGLPPAGLCGSGLISLLGELLENGLINNRGRFTRTTEAGSSAFPVSGDHGRPAAEDREGGDYHIEPLAFQFPGQGIKKLMIGGGGEISVDEEDLSQLLQAKAAVTAGIRIALRRFGLRCRDLEVCYLAGAFGRYLSLESASAIGLVPRLEPDTFRRLGNSSIEGAVLALLSVSARAGLERTVGKIIHLELESEPDFFELYTEGCLLEAIPDA